jgi:hypothetical protein
MPDEFQLHQQSAKALRAKELLENELLTEAFAGLKNGYLAQLMATNVMQADVREKCYLAMRVVDVVQDHLKTIIANGKLAESDLKELAKTAERKKRFGLI